MVCLYCGGPTEVTNSRLKKRLNAVWRRRRCRTCGSLITTEERPLYASSLAVRRTDGRLEPFLRDQLVISLYKSLAHRPQAAQDASALADTTIALLRRPNQGHDAVLELISLRQAAADCLQRFDSTAHSHYVAYHPTNK